MYFTKGRRRQYERLMQEKPGFNRIEVSEDETEEPRKRGKESREAGQSKRSRRTKDKPANTRGKGTDNGRNEANGGQL
ncbi:MAG TPA: hypothetical protein VMS09_07630 [Paenibacillus sp.]|uniref:hypothetical protein n=1 Tax=Paenibacillus sp. TaxID=58172 RepID=UPI002CBC4A2E|nr:hypothetical protein [Paenibacillus sp.]HUC91882.1 hypothetical protein [Paenibacillus sp.]